MRVLHVTPYYAPAWAWGGVVAAVTGLARAQAGAGHRVSVLTTDTLGPRLRGPAGVASLDGVEVWRVATRCPATRARFNLSWPRGFARKARGLVERAGIEIVHCHELRSIETLVATRVASRCGVATLLSPHGTLPQTTGRRLLKRTWDRLLAPRVLPRIRHVVALDRAEAEAARSHWLAHHGPLQPEQLSIVPNGVDPAEPVADGERREARRRLGLAEGDRVVLFLGRLHRRKRIPLLIDAFARFAARCESAKLILAGPDEGALAGIQKAIARLELGARVSITGMVVERSRRDVLAAADVLALVGAGEGMPMAALEALAAGVPVVLGEECGLAEIEAAGAGRVVAAEPTAIAAAFEGFAVAADGGSEARRRARELVSRRFAWPIIVSQLERVMERALRPAAVVGAGD